MAKKLLSPELSQVLKDIDNTREAINEKYAMVGHPDPIPSPLLSHDMAEAVRAITSIGDLPELDGTVELTYNEKHKKLPEGYYKNGIDAKIKDYAVSYIWNRQGIPAKTQYVNINESFTIPDFGITEVESEEFRGWSHMPNDEDPEYLTGDVVNHFQYEPRLEDPQYISYLYAVWELLKLTPIELSFEYANGGKLNSSNQEIVKMKVNGQRLDYPNLQRKYEVQGSPQIVEDIEMGDIWYKHQFTFNQIGIYPVIVTHTGKNGNSEVATGVMKVAGRNGSMSDDGSFQGYDNGTWYDSGWVDTKFIPGCYISGVRFYANLPNHGGSNDYFCIFAKKSNGSTYIIYDYGDKSIRSIDLTNLGTTAMNGGDMNAPIVLGSITLKKGNLGEGEQNAPGPSKNDMLHFTLSDDIRQVRFFAFAHHALSSGCFDGSTIDYDINYEFDMNLWEADKKRPSDPGGGEGGDTPSVQPVDMRISSLSLTPGTLSPTFDKDIHNYTLNIQPETSSISFTCSLVDDRAECTINGSSGNSINLDQPNGIRITKLDFSTFVKSAYSSYPTVNDGKYIVNIKEEDPVDLKLQSLSITPGKLSPSFNTDILDYELIIPAGTDKVKIDAITVDDRAVCHVNGAPNYLIDLRPDGELYVKIELDVITKTSYTGSPTINGTEAGGHVRNYTLYIKEEGSSSPTVPTLSEGNYSYEDPNNCLPQKWGYYEMTKLDGREEYLELYRRIYNAIKYGDTKTSYDYQEYGTTNIKTQNPAIIKDLNITGLTHPISAILVPLDDLSLDNNQAHYVYKCVCADCPELMWRFSSAEDKTDNDSNVFAVGKLSGTRYAILPYFKSSVKNNYLSVCESTFQEICSIVQNTYGITFQDDTFSNNNARYTEDEKKKVGKVIHDYLETNNVYGFVDAPDCLNQIMYPALSKGASHPVCASYAQALKYCYWRWGIHAVCVNGGCGNARDGRHQWNLVSYKTDDIGALEGVGSAWQEVDCTWDDPYGENGVNIDPNACCWKYFNVTTSDLESDQPTKDYVAAVKAAGFGFEGGDPTGTVRSRFATKYPIIANTSSAINIEHYINYPANGTCTSNRYDFFDNTNKPPTPQFNGQVYYGF